MSFNVFVPSHITGFFCINDDLNILKKGSLGAGVLIKDGVKTNIKKSNNSESKILINGKEDSYNKLISENILNQMKNTFNISDSVIINHNLDLPIGHGFGTSASCALGTAISFWKYFDLDISFQQATHFAHKSEIEFGGGLGDVIAETSKGIVLRTKSGAPGYGETKTLNIDNLFKNNFKENIHEDIDFPDIYLISKTLGSIETSSVINSSYYKKIINFYGKSMLEQLIAKPTIKNFLNLSFEFALNSKLMNDDVLSTINLLKEETLGASMAMLGNTAFALSLEKETSIENPIISKVDFEGIKF